MKKLAIFLPFLILIGCSSSNETFKKNPVDQFIIDMSDVNDFTILLQDMDAEEHLFTADIFRHKYKIITMGADSIPVSKETDWYDVSPSFFQLHSGDIGMEIASKVNGKVSKQVSPPGYSGYVGNSQYGEWKTNPNTGTSFWEFYGRYAMMRSLFNMAYYGPIYRSSYTDYRRYSSSGRNYYGGSSGSPRYGTYSSGVKKSNPTFANRMSKSSSFRNSVNKSVSRSPAKYAAGSRSTSTTKSTNSRYSSGSSSRSRSSSRGGK
ncbi:MULTISPECIES: hypothetical protein [Flammeovirga]|uniref:Lipoprotein n=1 Tax=Flammeovirga agarivorans TaxID=2726742 RepID=A0A7X8SIH9_9BACT|nr:MULTISPECIES: hypothetical protein [Flammeovirga]NLR90742.1 hypothetical protein [Flammeovirga agarivorans]